MKRLITLPLALLMVWFAGCTSDLTSPVGLGPQTSAGEAGIDAFATASVVTGFLHSCALTADGTAYCWGDNGYGQLGVERRECAPISNPGLFCELTPMRVRGGLTFTSLSAGAYHTCGITPTGELYCWGLNRDGQLGVPTGETCISGIHPCSSTPLQVTSGIRNVDGGFNHTCALTTAGQPYCWGGNRFGQLGVNDTNNRATPTPVHGQHTFASIESGGEHTCALTASGVAHCWGINDKGQLGAPSTQTCFYVGVPYACQMAPIPVSGGLRFASLSVGHQHTCGIVAPAPSPAPAARQSAATGPVFMFASHTPAAWGTSPDNGAVPAAPSGLSATAVSSSQINLAWTDNSTNEDGFQVWRVHNEMQRLVAQLGPNVTSYSDTGLQPSNTYYYGVVAVNAAGTSAPSNPASATTHPAAPSPPPPPAAPSALQANATSPTQVNLSWTDNSGNEDGFRVERHAGDGNFSVIATLGPNVTSFSNGSLSEGMAYTYRVQAFNAGGASSWSNAASATTWPHAPTSLAAQGASSSQMNLSWNDNSQRESGYEVQRSTNSAPFATIATLGANSTSYSDTGLLESNTYIYRVRATRVGASSAWSNQATPPGTPAGVTAYGLSPTQIQLTWFDTSNNEEGFRIERHAGDGNFTLIAVVGPNVTQYINSSLSEGTAYTYRVQAFNAGDASFWSRTASTWTWLNTPTNLAAQAVSSSQININWTDNSQRETGYEVHRKQGSSAFFPIATLGANTTSFSDTELQPGTNYTYRVRAIIVGIGSASAFSNEASATTHPVTPPPGGPAPPTNLAATLVQTNEIRLDWHPSPDADGYRIERHAGDGAFVEIFQLGVHWFNDRNLQLGRTYTYRVRAYTLAGGLSAYSNEASASTPAPPSAGNVYCWGNNVRGQLGVNIIQDFFTTPTRVWGGHDFSLVTTGTDHTCGLLADGRAYCWGWNGDGQFGNGNFGVDAGSRAPIPTTPGLTWRLLSAGQNHSCGISTGGLTYCWGQNPRGQIGDGTRNIMRPSPTLVLPPSP